MTNEAELRKNLEVMFEVLQNEPSEANEKQFLIILSDYRTVQIPKTEAPSETKADALTQ